MVELLYSGSLIRIRVELIDGTLLVAKKAVSLKGSKCRIGDKIRIYVSPKNILVYPYPKEGLSKDLALE